MEEMAALMEEMDALAPGAEKRRINDLMREGLREQHPDEPIPFFCECDGQECYRAVWLTGRQYDGARRSGTWQAISHHERSGEGEAARIGVVHRSRFDDR